MSQYCTLKCVRVLYKVVSFTMQPCISRVYSIRETLPPAQYLDKIKTKILKFRNQELEELLVFLNLDNKGTKPILRERVLKSLEKEFVRNVPLAAELEAKIEELDELCRIKIKRGVQYVGPLYYSRVFPMFTELRQLVNGQKFKIHNGQQSLCFTLTTHLVHKILSGKQADGNYRCEIQLNVWNCVRTTEEWSDIYLNVDVNGMPIDVLHPSPHLIYLTRRCILKPLVKNTITISSSRPQTLNDYAFCICVVKRFFPTEIIENNPVKESCDTHLLVSKELDEQENRSFKMHLTCSDTISVMSYPCRSVLCKHPDVFDLKNFLEDNQYYQQWKCPVCQQIIAYEDIVMDMYLKKYLDQGEFIFHFYKRRANDKLTDKVDKDIECEIELITIQD